MRLRILPILLLLACLPHLFAQSQYVQFVGTNVADLAGNKLQSGTLTVTPVLAPGSTTPAQPHLGTGGHAIGTSIVFTITNGVLAPTYGAGQLADVTQASPANFCYATAIHDNNSGDTWYPDSCMQPAYNATWCSVGAGVTTCNYDNYVPTGTPGTLQTTGPAGPAGAAGSPGPAMTPRGAYSSGATYSTGDLVSFSGKLYACISGCSGVTPVAGANWMIVPSSTVAVGVFSCDDYASISACFADVNTYVGTNESGSGHAAIAELGDATYSTGGTTIALRSGIGIKGVKPRFVAVNNSWGAGAVPNGGTWIECNGQPCMNAVTGGGNGQETISMEDLGFKNWGSYIYQSGAPGVVGQTYGTFHHIFGIGSSTLNVSDRGLVFWNSQILDVQDVNIINVNTGISMLSDGANSTINGNSTVSNFYTYTYPKSVANGNNGKPCIDIEGPLMNLLSFNRPQCNTYAGDQTGVGLFIKDSNNIALHDLDMEVNALNAVQLVNSSNVVIDGAVYGFGTSYTRVGLNIDNASHNNTLLSQAAFFTVCLQPGGSGVQRTNTFIGAAIEFLSNTDCPSGMDGRGLTKSLENTNDLALNVYNAVMAKLELTGAAAGIYANNAPFGIILSPGSQIDMHDYSGHGIGRLASGATTDGQTNNWLSPFQLSDNLATSNSGQWPAAPGGMAGIWSCPGGGCQVAKDWYVNKLHLNGVGGGFADVQANPTANSTLTLPPLSGTPGLASTTSSKTGYGVCWKDEFTLGKCTAGTWPSCSTCN